MSAPIPNIKLSNAMPVEQKEEKKPIEILHLFEKNRIYGQSKVAVIFCKSKKITKELTETILKLDKAIKDKDLLDNKRSWAKTKTLWNAGAGAWAWRQLVNELDIQKVHVKNIAESVINKLQQNKSKIEILSLVEKADENINLNKKYFEETPEELLKFFIEKRYKFV